MTAEKLAIASVSENRAPTEKHVGNIAYIAIKRCVSPMPHHDQTLSLE